MIPINLVYDPATGRLVYDPVSGRLVCAGSGTIPYWTGTFPDLVRNGWTYKKTGSSLSAMQSAAWVATTDYEIGETNVLAPAASQATSSNFRTIAVALKSSDYIAAGTVIGKMTVNMYDRTARGGPPPWPDPPRGDVQLGWAASDSEEPPSDDWDWVGDAPFVSLSTTGNHVVQANLTASSYVWLFAYYEYAAYNNTTRFEVSSLPIEI
jgi:hypothetical protein